MRATRLPGQSARSLLIGAVLGILLEADAQSHGQEQLHRPEALLRKAWLTLSPTDWIRRQRLDAAREHRLPSDFSACSSLEGPSCLSSTEKPVSVAWAGLEGTIITCQQELVICVCSIQPDDRVCACLQI